MKSMPLTLWLVQKISLLLQQKEGMQVTQYPEVGTQDRIIMEVQDAFGFRYEVSVKAIGRISTETAISGS